LRIPPDPRHWAGALPIQGDAAQKDERAQAGPPVAADPHGGESEAAEEGVVGHGQARRHAGLDGLWEAGGHRDAAQRGQPADAAGEFNFAQRRAHRYFAQVKEIPLRAGETNHRGFLLHYCIQPVSDFAIRIVTYHVSVRMIPYDVYVCNNAQLVRIITSTFKKIYDT